MTTLRIQSLPTATFTNHYRFIVMDRFEAR